MLICLIFVLLQHEDISLNCLGLSIVQTTVHVRRFSVSALKMFGIHILIPLILAV